MIMNGGEKIDLNMPQRDQGNEQRRRLNIELRQWH